MPENKKFLKETEWARIYAVGPNDVRYESKFFVDGLTVSATHIKERWSAFNEEEKMDFVQAFQAKIPITAEDEEILKFLMQVGNESVWSTIALPLTRMHSSLREQALNFLMSRAEEESVMQANYYQALAELRDPRATPVLRTRYARHKTQVSLHKPLDSFEDIAPYIDYLTCCAALYRLDGSEEYKQAIEQMESHIDEKVRLQAKLALR